MAFLSYSGTSLLTMGIFVGVVGEGVGDKTNEKNTRWWFQILFSPLVGEDFQFE